MSEQKVRIGFVGVGGMGQCAHLRNYASNRGCEVVAIAELRDQTAKRVAEKYRVPKVYGDFREMLAKESLDGIVASQPFSRHSVLLPELLQAGKPIFIEKPLSSTLQGGEQIVKLLKQSASWVMVGYHKRSDPASMYAQQTVRQLQASGELGKLTYVRILMPAGDWIANGFWDLVNEGDKAGALERTPPPADMDEAGFKAYDGFVNYYIHQVNLMRFFLGEPYEVRYADPSGVLLAGQSASGVACSIEMSPYQTSIDWQESVFVAFQHGYVKLELPAPLAVNRPGRVEVLKDPGKGVMPQTIVPQFPWNHAMRQQAENFLAAIRGERQPPCDAFEALEDLRVARAYLKLWKNV